MNNEVVASANEVLALIMNHRSIRKFTNESLTQAQIATIVRAAQMAASSSFMQSYSIIGLTDPALKRELRETTRTPYVEENGHLFIFCADLHRVGVMGSEADKQQMSGMLATAAFYQIAVVDAALAAQNAVLAAESMGLGAVIMGSVNRDIKRLDEMLQLPSHVMPLFGIAVGVPDQEPEIKPRLAMDAVYFENRYASDDEQRTRIAAYDQSIERYYQTRSENNRTGGWSGANIAKLKTNMPLQGLTDFMRSKGLNVT